MKQIDFIPKWLLPIMVIIIIISLIAYFLISKSPRIEDLFINLAATVSGILLTLFVVDKVKKYYEKKEWSEFEEIITNQIIDTLFTLCNYFRLNPSFIEQWMEIFGKDIDKKEKVIQLIILSQSSKIDPDYIRKIILDDHLIKFFSNGYGGVFKRLDDIFRLYQNRLPANISTEIINLKLSLSALLSNMSTFQMFNIAINEFDAKIEPGHVNEFSKNVSKTINTSKMLLDSV
jgi:prepilin signal peptidase PulO-like enzyme (type II secretory pathway)